MENQFRPKPVQFVVAATRHGPLIVGLNDHHGIGGLRFGVGHQIFASSCYEPEEILLVTKLLHLRRELYGDGVVFLDCGANIGIHSVECAKLMTDWGCVVAFEPQERLYYALAGNLVINNCQNARALNVAIGSSTGKIHVPSLDFAVASSYGSLELRRGENNEDIGQSVEDAGGVLTELVTIDSLQLERVDFIKIDIEGMELEALCGAREVIRRFSPQMLIEKIKVDAEALLGVLSELGYVVFDVGMNFLAVHNSDHSIGRISHS